MKRSSSAYSGPNPMTVEDGAAVAKEESGERSNGTRDGNIGVEVAPDVIDITLTLGSDSDPKDASQDPLDPVPSSPSPASTSGEHSTITNAATSDNVDPDAPPIHATKAIYQLSIPIPPDRTIHNPASSMSTATAVRSPPPTLSMSSLAELSLHSPSSQIVGTPFASSSMPERFEYPFPDTPSSNGSPPLVPAIALSQAVAPQPSMVSISPMLALGSSPSSALANASIVPPRTLTSPPASSSPTIPFSTHHTNPTASTAYVPSRAATLPYSAACASQSHVHAQAEAPPVGPVYGNYTTYTPAHPKLRAQASAADPPVPPSLVRKRRGWNLGMGLLGRRRSATAPIGADGHERSPMGSPGSEHGN